MKGFIEVIAKKDFWHNDQWIEKLVPELLNVRYIVAVSDSLLRLFLFDRYIEFRVSESYDELVEKIKNAMA